MDDFDFGSDPLAAELKLRGWSPEEIAGILSLEDDSWFLHTLKSLGGFTQAQAQTFLRGFLVHKTRQAWCFVSKDPTEEQPTTRQEFVRERELDPDGAAGVPTIYGEDLRQEMMRWLKGEKDWFDKIIDFVRAKIRLDSTVCPGDMALFNRPQEPGDIP